jgi:hypothetical protein
MPATIKSTTKVDAFVNWLQAHADRLPCQVAVDWLSAPRFAGKNMGFVLDTFVSEALPDTEYPSWATWNLHLWRHHMDEYLRRSFILAVHDEMDAYLLLKNATEDEAGDDWSEEERDLLRARFRGKLPHEPGADTL